MNYIRLSNKIKKQKMKRVSTVNLYIIFELKPLKNHQWERASIVKQKQANWNWALRAITLLDTKTKKSTVRTWKVNCDLIAEWKQTNEKSMLRA